MNKSRVIVTGLLVLGGLTYGLYEGFRWGVMRTFVAHDEVLIVTNRFGETLPPDRRTVKGDEPYKGVQEEVLGPGRYFFDPVRFDTRIEKQTVISAGDPSKWEWNELGSMRDPAVAPQVGLVTSLEGNTPADGEEVVGPGFKGIMRTVLTPGTYKINPVKFKVETVPAVVVPPGSVGVVTRLVGEDAGLVESQALAHSGGAGASTKPAATSLPLVTGPKQRGILRDVLQPGIYYLNPRLVRVTVVPVGYDAITTRNDAVGSQVARTERSPLNRAIQFLTKDGYQVEADFTVVWGRRPVDAPELVRNIGNVDRVAEIVIAPAMKAAAQNEGGKYSARELIQGQTRSQFQEALSASLEAQVRSRNLEVLLALVRNITIKDKPSGGGSGGGSGGDSAAGLLETIQLANIEVERELTNQQKTQTAAKRAEYEQALKQVDVARETVASESLQRVANILAEAAKQAAQIAAQTDVEVAKIRADVAQLDAQRTTILGRANAEVSRLKNDAEAQGARLLVEALGSPAAYNQYVFARAFEPKELRLIFAGPGTLWTDLKSFQELGAASVVREAGQGAATRPAGEGTRRR